MSSPRKDLDESNPDISRTDADSWERRERLNKTEAERLLDWLEANGYSRRELSSAEDGSFTVLWRR